MERKSYLLRMILIGLGAVILSGTGYASKGHRVAASPEALAPDVSRDDGMYFFCEGEKVIIQNCKGVPTTPGKGCEGDRRVVGKKLFIEELSNELSLNSDFLKRPYSDPGYKVGKKYADRDSKEVVEWLKAFESQAQIINDFIDKLKNPKTKEESLENLQNAKTNTENLIKLIKNKKADTEAIAIAIDKMNSVLDDIVKQICDPAVTINLNSNDSSNKSLQFMTKVLKQYDPAEITNNSKSKFNCRSEIDNETQKNLLYCKDNDTGLTWGPIEDWDKIKQKQTSLVEF
jgi:hypothetical protein